MDRVTLHDVITATGGDAVGLSSLSRAVTRVELDSRKTQPGDLFWAVRGERLDGHDFATEALHNGAMACVVSRERSRSVVGPRIAVPETTAALANFARHYRTLQSATVIGITGSVGKTTTRNLVHLVLGSALPGVESPGNFNNHFGLPLSLLNIEKHDRYAVMELGASHVGEIRELASIAKPEIGAVTAIDLAHVAGFGSLEHIAIAKGELVEALPVGGLAVLAGDHPRVRGLSTRTKARVIFVGEGPDSHLRPANVRSIPGRLTFRVDGAEYSLAATGHHVLTSALIAVAIAQEFGIASADIAQGFATYRPLKGRGEIRRFGAITVIDDTYNANPASMRAAVHVLRDWAGPGRCILVAGDMLELGAYSPGCHRQLGEEAAACGIHGIIAFGQAAEDVIGGAETSGHPTAQLKACQDIAEVYAALDDWLQPGDVVLVKGSRGMKMERIVARLEETWGVTHRDYGARLHRASA